mgnify:CR=1 FL=1
MTGVAKASFELGKKRLSRDPAYSALQGQINLALGNIAKVLAAESGRLTEQDAERARSALADLQGWTDTRKSAIAKIAEVETALANIANNILRSRQPTQTPATGTGTGVGGGAVVPGIFNDVKTGELYRITPDGKRTPYP